MNRYPDPDATLLRRRLAERYETEPGRVAVGNGSCEILLAAAQALCEPGDEIVYAWPSFSIYPYLAALTGAREIRVPLAEGDVHDLDAMAAEVTAATQLLIVCNPNNPTGTHIPAERIAAFCERVPAARDDHPRRGLHRVPDQRRPRRDARPARRAPEPRPPAHLQQVPTGSPACGSATRSARPQFRAAIDAVRQPFSVNALAQAAAAEAILHQDDVARRVESNADRAGPGRVGRSTSSGSRPRRDPGQLLLDRPRRGRRGGRGRRRPRRARDRGPARDAARRPRPPARHLRHPRRERALPRGARPRLPRLTRLNLRHAASAVLQTVAVKRTARHREQPPRHRRRARALPVSPTSGDLARRPAWRRLRRSQKLTGRAPIIVRASVRARTGISWPEVGLSSFGGW